MKKNKHYQALAAALSLILFITLVFWASGFNFDKRGEILSGYFLISGLGSAFLYSMIKSF